MSTFLPWNVEHFDLSEGVPTLSVPEGRGGVFAVFWWRGLPLAQRMVPSEQLPLAAPALLDQLLPEIANVAGNRMMAWKTRKPGSRPGIKVQSPDLEALVGTDQPLRQLDEILASRDEASPLAQASISIAICTRDRAEPLERCLRSLQKLDEAPLEIILIDNAPRTDDTQRVVEKMQAEMPHLRYVLEPRPGLDAARNAGVRAATGDILAFTDDDVEVHPGWLSGLRRGFDMPQVMAVTGLVLPAELEYPSQVQFETKWSFGRGYCPITFDKKFFRPERADGVRVWDIGAGANMAFRREVFARVGGFDERLGAGASGCSDDSEFWYRVLAEGFECRYEPSAVVKHYHRSNDDGLSHQLHSYMKGHVAALLIQHQKYGHRGNLRRAFIQMPLYYAKLLAIRTRQGPSSWVGGLRDEVTGCVAGVDFYLKHRNDPESEHVFRVENKSSARPPA